MITILEYLACWCIFGAIGTILALLLCWTEGDRLSYKDFIVFILCTLGAPVWMIYVGVPAIAMWLE